MFRINAYPVQLPTALALLGLVTLWGCSTDTSSLVSPGELNPTFQNTATGGECVVADVSEEEEVLEDVFLTWESSIFCAEVDDAGEYQFTIVVSYDAGDESVTINDVVLAAKTPRPRRQVPAGTLDMVNGLPLTLSPGDAGSFSVSGTYGLVETDEGKKANFHFRALGAGGESGDPFALGFNGHFRAPGATE